MAFIDIKNPKERDEIVQNYLSTINQIRQRNEDKKAVDFTKKQVLEATFKPIVRATEKSTAAITEELRKKKERAKEDVIEPTLSHYLSLDKKVLDKYFGIQRKADGRLVLGNTEISVEGSKITVGNETFDATPGVWSLIMLNNPQEYTSEDYDVYRTIAGIADVANNPQNVGNGRPEQTHKYKLLEKLYEGRDQEEGQSGEGIQFLPSDIPGLFSKLALLIGEFKAGNLCTRNEIVAILDELKRRGKLPVKGYREINNILSKTGDGGTF